MTVTTTKIPTRVYCHASAGNVPTVQRGDDYLCSRCGSHTHPVTRFTTPLTASSRFDRTSVRYQANLDTLTAIQSLFHFGVHGDDGDGWADLEFRDLIAAVSFLQVIRPELKEIAQLRPVTSFAVPVVVRVPVPDDRDLLGVPSV